VTRVRACGRRGGRRPPTALAPSLLAYTQHTSFLSLCVASISPRLVGGQRRCTANPAVADTRPRTTRESCKPGRQVNRGWSVVDLVERRRLQGDGLLGWNRAGRRAGGRIAIVCGRGPPLEQVGKDGVGDEEARAGEADAAGVADEEAGVDVALHGGEAVAVDVGFNP